MIVKISLFPSPCHPINVCNATVERETFRFLYLQLSFRHHRKAYVLDVTEETLAYTILHTFQRKKFMQLFKKEIHSFFAYVCGRSHHALHKLSYHGPPGWPLCWKRAKPFLIIGGKLQARVLFSKWILYMHAAFEFWPSHKQAELLFAFTVSFDTVLVPANVVT
jgi:hypothetical protein